MLFVSCNKENEGADTQTQTQTQTQSEITDGFAVAKDGVAARIIYPNAEEEKLLKKAQSLAASIKKETGIEAKVTSDILLKGQEEYDSSTVEILLGNTKYPQSAEVMAELSDYGECKIKVVGNKLVVASWDNEGVEKGISEISVAIREAIDNNKNVILPSDFSMSVYGSGTVGLARLPIYSKITPKIIYQGDECFEYVFARANKDDFDAYANMLKNQGYSLYTENTIAGKTQGEDNLFKTYKNDDCAVHLSIMPGIAKMFVIVDDLSKTALPSLYNKNIYDLDASGDTLFTQVGLYSYTPDDPDAHKNGEGTPSFTANGSKDTNGQSNVIRLIDGSFIIIDGGHGDAEDAENLYKLLRTQAPDKDNIVIAAWIFTHAHNDHVMTFPAFVREYGKSVKFEQVILNFPSEDTAKAGGGDCRSNVYSMLSAACFREAKIIKAHVGQKFFIRNATLEMLCNFEMLQPYNLKKNDNSYNNASLVFRVEIENVKFMILGDCYNEQSEIIPKCYGSSALKSDVVQVAHHGIGGTGEAVYSLIDADYAIWPAGNYYYDFPAWGNKFDYIELTKHSYNSWFTNPENISPENIYWALDDLDIFTLRSGSVSVETKTFEEYLTAE